jgi:predicted GNAT family acetyltransferase
MGQMVHSSAQTNDGLQVIDNKRLYRFEIALPDSEIATLEYRWRKAAMALMHTIVPASQRGHGVGAILVKYALENARARHFKVLPYCSYVVDYLAQHPEYSDVVEG